jgi:hypothetical protein
MRICWPCFIGGALLVAAGVYVEESNHTYIEAGPHTQVRMESSVLPDRRLPPRQEARSAPPEAFRSGAQRYPEVPLSR